MAKLAPRDLQGAEVHDCFSITEIVAYEILGLAEPGKGVELVKSGATTLPQVRPEKSKAPFEIPVNAGGGLIGLLVADADQGGVVRDVNRRHHAARVGQGAAGGADDHR